jgi:hypothetical protein
MNKKVVAVGLLAGGIALTGLAGSAYAEGSAPVKKTIAANGHGPTAVACWGTSGPVKDKAGEKGIVTMPGEGKLPPLPKPPASISMIKVRDGKVVAGTAKGVKVVQDKDGRVTVTAGTPPKGLPVPPKGLPPKGVHCTTVKPGTPGAPPPLPAR